MRISFVLTILALALSGTDSLAQTYRVRHERGTDYEKFKTFAWMDGTRVYDETSHDYIVQFITDRLGINGIFMDENEPDLYVVYHTSVDGEFKITGGYSMDWRGADAIAVSNHVAGTLVIDLVDAADNQLIWRATATATVNQNPKKNREKVRKALDKMFAGFPPRK